MAWEVSLESEVEEWLLDLQHHPQTADEVVAAIDKLEQDGPTLGRPLVDRIHVPIADERFSRHLKAIEEGKP
ncbi:hypothetical protein [Kitasatospora phosalacinea]|uniref:hypothetical protein n=1 Tax=Kitasatospora phosalacinea TaxID=2065 RepID=UPI002553F35B|nr:hypothetical protein [Kitasatospora phosalacinea]